MRKYCQSKVRYSAVAIDHPRDDYYCMVALGLGSTLLYHTLYESRRGKGLVGTFSCLVPPSRACTVTCVASYGKTSTISTLRGG